MQAAIAMEFPSSPRDGQNGLEDLPIRSGYWQVTLWHKC